MSDWIFAEWPKYGLNRKECDDIVKPNHFYVNQTAEEILENLIFL